MLPSTYRWKLDEKHTGDNLIEKILNNRGIYSEEEIKAFLNPVKEALHSPYLLNDMEKAVKRIAEAKEKSVVIYGDYDVDGITSTSILYMFLKSCNYQVSYYIPNRQSEGYGLNKEAIARISEYADLIITVDTGIAAVEEVDFANSIGLDVIITDHHECQAELPRGYCIINPKRKDSTYPFDALAGVGVTFKLIHALAIYHQVEETIWQYLDIVALGTIADVVPLIQENRAITYLGFEMMQHTVHIGLRELMELVCEGDTTGKINSNMIAYQIGPRLNAAGRLSDAKIGVELLTTQDENKAKALARLLDEENKKRQDMEADIIRQAEVYIDDHVDTEQEKVFVVVGKGWHHGVIGIVASKIMAKYYRPTIVLTEEDGILSGSARSIEGFNIFEAVNATKDYLVRFGGHEMAAGLSLKAENLEAFRRGLNEQADVLIDSEMLIPSIEIDLDMNLEDVNLDFCMQLESLEPFGACNPVPLFSIRGKVQYAQKMGQDDKHLRLTLEQNKTMLQAVGFYKGYLADYLSEGEEVIVVGEIVKNVWNNRTSVQLRIRDIQSAEEEVLKSKYYTSLYHYLKTPSVISKAPMMIKDETAFQDAKALCIYTEEGLLNAYKILKNKCKNVNLDVKICYNKVCVKKNEVILCVNPIETKGDGLQYEWDYQTVSEPFAACCTDFASHKNQLVKMIPTHKDCIEVYKLLKSNESESIPVHKVIVRLSMYAMTEYKLFQILEIFKELNLLSYCIAEDQIQYKIIPSDKTRLDRSPKYRELEKFSECIQQLY